MRLSHMEHWAEGFSKDFIEWRQRQDTENINESRISLAFGRPLRALCGVVRAAFPIRRCVCVFGCLAGMCSSDPPALEDETFALACLVEFCVANESVLS
jgi:hypothetical protein